MTSIKIVALIPARGGSKRIPGKNIKLYAGKPLIHWSIILAKQSMFITDVVVSTDCQNIANAAKISGARVPFLRPKPLSGDLSTDLEFIRHYLDWTKLNEPDKYPDYVVHLRPTYPNRKLSILNDCILKFTSMVNCTDSLRTVCSTDKPPYKMYTINDKNKLVPLFKKVGDICEPFNQPVQKLPKTFWHNGYIDILKPNIVYNGCISGDDIYPYIMNKTEIDDIDTMEEWIKSEQRFIDTFDSLL